MNDEFCLKYSFILIAKIKGFWKPCCGKKAIAFRIFMQKCLCKSDSLTI